MPATSSIKHEVLVRFKQVDGSESERVIAFDSSERTPDLEEAREAARKLKEDFHDKPGFVAILLRRTSVVSTLDHVDQKTTIEAATYLITTYLI